MLGSLLLLLGLPIEASAHDPDEHILTKVAFDQRLDGQVPLDLMLNNENGKAVSLASFFGEEKPIVLQMGYFECPNLCPLARDGLLGGLEVLDFNAGEEFNVLLVSIDPRETPEIAANKKEYYVQSYNRPNAEQGWHFLTGDEETTHALAESIGFSFAYDEESEQYAHPSGLVILTPEGKVSSYLFGLEFRERDLRLGIIEAAKNRIGSPIDQILLLCYHYDPKTGQYTLSIMNVIRIFGTITVLILGLFILKMLRHERKQGPPSNPTSGALNPV
jgi:protein SCO1/2